MLFIVSSFKLLREIVIFKLKLRVGNFISFEFEKKEYFDIKEVLEEKINIFVEWIK